MTCAPVLTACCRPAPPTRLTLTLTLTLTSVLETGTAHPVVIVATTHMHGGLGNLSGQVRLALHTRYCTPPTGATFKRWLYFTMAGAAGALPARAVAGQA